MASVLLCGCSLGNKWQAVEAMDAQANPPAPLAQGEDETAANTGAAIPPPEARISTPAVVQPVIAPHVNVFGELDGQSPKSSASRADFGFQQHTYSDEGYDGEVHIDPTGKWRDQENGLTIDASGDLPSVPGPFNTPFELIEKLASSEKTQQCLAENWMTFAYARKLEAADSCSKQSVNEAFAASGSNVKQLLVALTQAPAFLYLSSPETPQ